MARIARILVVAVVALLPFAAEPARAAQAPADVVETLHAALLDVMKNAEHLGVQGRYDKLKPTLTSVYDFEAMTRLTTGTAWPAAAAQRAALVDAFTRLSIATYADRFKGYSGERFEALGQRPGPRETVIVDTRLVRPADPAVPLSYVVQDRGGGAWRIIDVIVEGSISELAVRRSEYAQILRQGGVDKLTAVLNGKADEMLHPGG